MLQRILFEYGWIVVLITLTIGYFTVYYKKHGQKKTFEKMREAAYGLMLLAEKKFGAKTGKRKFDWVADRVYILLPKSMKIFVSENDLREWLQELFDTVKDKLDDGEINGTV